MIISVTRQPELMPVLKDIVTLRATIGSPLRSFTIFNKPPDYANQEWELIGQDGRFTIEEVFPAQEFELDV